MYIYQLSLHWYYMIVNWYLQTYDKLLFNFYFAVHNQLIFEDLLLLENSINGKWAEGVLKHLAHMYPPPYMTHMCSLRIA
jgi:hypothetical protein